MSFIESQITDNRYTGHNTKAKLKDLPVSIINETLANKEDRKAVQVALKQIGSGQVSGTKDADS